MATAEVDWVGLGEDKFSRMVQVMVKRRWDGIADVHSPDGRGGDAGVDVLVVDQTGRRRVYQIKYFPDGFSGDRKRTRQKQIRNSFKRALALEPPPYEWILVVPKTLTPGERQFVVGLAEDGGPKITICDSDDLDLMIAGMPDIYNYLIRDRLQDLVSMYGLETALMLGDKDDLGDRLTNLGKVADSLSPHWGVDFARRGQSIEVALRPKHVAAAVDDPITAQIKVAFGPDDGTELAAFKRSMGFGARGQVRLPPSVVTRASIASSHPLFSSEMTNPEVILEAQSRIGPQQAEFRFIDSAGAVAASQDAVLEHANHGTEGGSMAFRILDRIEIEVDFAVSVGEDGEPTFAPGGPMQLRYRLADLYPDELMRCLDFLAGLSDGKHRCEVLIEGQRAFVFTSEFEVDDEMDKLASAAYDLAAVQDDLKQRFRMPIEIGTKERIDLRVTRAILEGYFVESPSAANYNVTLAPDQIDLPELDQILAEGRPVNLGLDDFALTIGDRTIPIGGVRVATACAKFVDGEQLRQAVEEGRTEPYDAVMRPTNQRYFLLYKQDRIPTDESEQQQAWWTLPGIEQPGEPPAD